MAKAVWLTEDLGLAPRGTLIHDAGASPATAATAARDAINQGANVIVGPIFSAQTPAVLQAAGDVPVITLSNDDTLAQIGAWVFGVTPRQSMQAVVSYAKSSGAQRIALVQSGDEVSARAGRALAEVAGAGVKTLPSVSAQTNPEDMRAALKTAGGGALPDIVYIPSRSERALAQGVAAVKAGVTTIGSLQWSSLPERDMKRLDKACFTGPDPVRFNQLSSNFRAHLEEDLGVISALAVDGVALAHSSGGNARLDRNASVEGLLGAAEFSARRTCLRTLSILRIDGGSVVRVA
jgi:methylmalonyl-CoA mutase cobalamin-binding subunit